MTSPRNDYRQHWPGWATWALVGVVLTSALTIVATLNDIF
jgi:hypothetical protein